MKNIFAAIMVIMLTIVMLGVSDHSIKADDAIVHDGKTFDIAITQKYIDELPDDKAWLYTFK